MLLDEVTWFMHTSICQPPLSQLDTHIYVYNRYSIHLEVCKVPVVATTLQLHR